MGMGGDREVRDFRSCRSTTSNVESALEVRAATTARVCSYPTRGPEEGRNDEHDIPPGRYWQVLLEPMGNAFL
jgi:hypothetical protein